MCERCEEIDAKIAHYRRIMGHITDQQFNDRATELIAELEAHKKALHPEQE
jgi:hypothetical protein